MDPITISLGILTGIVSHTFTILDHLGKVKGVTTRLISLAQKDLLNSISYFDKGVQLLKLAKSATSTELEKQERMNSAQESFKQAHKEASSAFNNAALTIEEKIMACRICIASSILQYLDDKDAAKAVSMLYLEKLNSLPEVGKLFSNTKPTLYKQWTAKNVDDVVTINSLLADFIFNFTSQRHTVLEWPLIESGEKIFHPLYLKPVEGITNVSTPWCTTHFCMDEAHLYLEKEITLTNEGELLIFSGNHLQKLDKETGKFQPWCKESCGIDDWKVECMTVDNKGVVYVLSNYGSKKLWIYQLTIFSNRFVQQCTLKLLDKKETQNLSMAVTQDEKIVFAFAEGEQRYVTLCACNKHGEVLQDPLPLRGYRSLIVDELKSLSAAADDTIAIITYRGERFRRFYRLLTYDMTGKFLKDMKFSPTLKEIREYKKIIYTPLTRRITGFYLDAALKLVIETFSAVTEQLQSSLMLMNTGYDQDMFNDSVRLVNHVNGKMAFVTLERIVYVNERFVKHESENEKFKWVMKGDEVAGFSPKTLPRSKSVEKKSNSESTTETISAKYKTKPVPQPRKKCRETPVDNF